MTSCLQDICLETGAVVIQGHQKCHHSIAWVWFPIRLLEQLWLYFAPFPRYTDLLVLRLRLLLPAPHPSEFYRPDALLAAQPTVSKHWRM